MDIRNIKTPQPEVVDDKYLEALFKIQVNLMEGYYKIEGLPRPPLDINLKSTQVILKDFSSRVIEEIAEGYESTTNAINICTSVGFNIAMLEEDQKSMILNHLQNSNEEMADATAFFTELMVYAQIGPEDIYNYINTVLKDKVGLKNPVVTLQDIMMVGMVLLIKDHRTWRNIKAESEWPVLKLVLEDSPGELNQTRYDKIHAYTPGFNGLSEYSHEQEALLIWDIAYHLNIGRNYLKNKTWKQSGEMTNELQYQEQVVLGFIKYCGYLMLVGFEPETLFHLCWRKNQVNVFRQQSNY